MEHSEQNFERVKTRAEKDMEIVRKIDAALCEETTLLEGLEWAVEHNWMSEEEADECYEAYIATRNPDPLDAA